MMQHFIHSSWEDEPGCGFITRPRCMNSELTRVFFFNEGKTHMMHLRNLHFKSFSSFPYNVNWVHRLSVSACQGLPVNAKDFCYS